MIDKLKISNQMEKSKTKKSFKSDKGSIKEEGDDE